MEMNPATSAAIRASLARMHLRSAFFSSLALFARFEASERVPTAATDGLTIYVNPEFLASLTPDEQDALLVHEVLHAALLHVPRRSGRDPQVWNIAADIVVNGMLVKEGYKLPEGGLRNAQIEHWSTEEVYEHLLKQQKPPDQSRQPDLLDGQPDDGRGNGDDGGAENDEGTRNKNQEKHWRYAHQQAKARANGSEAGSDPGAFERELGALAPSRIDWRSHLWRFLVKTPTDFQEFDRRFVGRGTYLETISGENLNVLIAVDTSSSVDRHALETFLSEVQSILKSYPHLRCSLYFADTQLYGPYKLTANGALPAVVGGGGTDFRPFFAQIPQHRRTWEPSVAIYMTDGFGPFPDAPPRCPVLWVVAPGGLALEQFPFGQTVRLLPRT